MCSSWIEIPLFFSVIRLILFVCQAFNWLLCNVIQTTCLHDILWHFVASLTPSPFEPEDEEDDENKGNKEIVEQVIPTEWFSINMETCSRCFASLLHFLIRNTSTYRKETLGFVNTLCQTLLLLGRQLIHSPTPSTASFRLSLISWCHFLVEAHFSRWH